MFLTFCNAYFPHKHRVCAVPFPRSPVRFVRLSLSCYVMRTSPQEHQFRQEPMTRSLYTYCTLESTLSRFLLFLELRYNRRCDQRRVTSDIASLWLGILKLAGTREPRGLLKITRSGTGLTPRASMEDGGSGSWAPGFVQCFSLGFLKRLHAYIGHVLSKRSNLFLHFLSTSKRFSSVPECTGFFL